MCKKRIVWFVALCSALMFGCTDDAGETHVDTGDTSADDGGTPSGNPDQPTDPGDEPGDEPGTDPGEDPGTDPGEDPGTDPGEDPGTDPGEDPGTDPGEDPTPVADPDNPGTEVTPIEDPDTDDTGVSDPDVTCDEICEVGQYRCTEGGSQICERINECPNWGTITNCAKCNESTGECLPDCQNGCTLNETKCDKNAVWTCVRGDDTCTRWEQTKACAANEVCDNAKCILGCKDECKENATRCADNGMQKCAKNETGCMVWKEDKACGTGQICSADGSKCEYACGNDCDPFSIILIPDTQFYTQSSALKYKDAKGAVVTPATSLMTKQMEWIVNNKDSKNIRFVLHLGDITNLNREQEWKDSVVAMKKLGAAGIPFSISTGNHDYVASPTLLPGRSKSKFSTYYTKDLLKSYFKGSSLADMKWFGEYKYGANSYSMFSVGNIHFLVFALEFYPRKDVIAWADSILNKPEFANYHVIVTTHGYVCSGGGYCGQQKQASTHYQVQGMGGKALFDEFIKRHSNIFMVAGGHSPGSEYNSPKNMFGDTVHELLVDYQMETPCQGGKCSNGTCQHGKTHSGNGWFRRLEIDPKTGNVKGYTQTVVGKGEYNFGSKNPEKHLFCTAKYDESATKGKNVNSFTFDVRPPKHDYNNKDNYGFMPRDLNNLGSGDQLNPVVVMNSTNGTFVGVWEDNSSADDGTYKDANGKEQKNFDIAFRLFKRGGYANGGQKFVTADNKSAKGNQKSPDIAMDKNGNFVIVWADDSDNNNYYEIMMTGFDSKGNIRFNKRTVNENSSGDQTSPKIAMADDGRFVVVWNDKQGKANINIKYKAFKADGTDAGKEAYLIDHIEGTRRNPAIAMDANGNYVIAWDDDKDNNGGYQMYAQKFDFSGKALSKVLVVNSDSAGQQLHGAVGMNSKGAFFVAYRDDRDKDKNYAIRVRGWDENLKEIITYTEVYNAKHNNSQPTVCVDDSNNAVIGFYDSNMTNYVTSNGSKTYDKVAGDILLATVSGKTIGKAVSPTRLVWNNQKMPSVACTTDGHVVVAYSDDADNNGAYETYVRGFNKIADIK